MNVHFEYTENNDEVINAETGTVLFSNFIKNGNKEALHPVPFSPSLGVFRNEDTDELAKNGVWYCVSYFHNGFISEINTECVYTTNML